MTVLVDNKCILQYARSLVSWKLWHHVEVRLHHQSFGVLCQLPLVDRLWAVDEQPTNLARGFSFCLGFSPGLSHPNRVIFFCLFWFLTRTLLVLAKGGWNYTDLQHKRTTGSSGIPDLGLTEQAQTVSDFWIFFGRKLQALFSREHCGEVRPMIELICSITTVVFC